MDYQVHLKDNTMVIVKANTFTISETDRPIVVFKQGLINNVDLFFLDDIKCIVAEQELTEVEI